MIEEFSVSNYRSIYSEQKLSFKPNNDTTLFDKYTYQVSKDVYLLKFGVIYGTNASGKSNILRALSFFSDLVLYSPDDKSEGIDYTKFLFDKSAQDQHSKMSMIFYLEKEKYILSIEFDNKRIYEESLVVYMTSQPTTLYNRHYDEDKDVTRIAFGSKSRINKASQLAIIGNTINNASVMSAFKKSNVETSRLDLVYNFFKRNLVDVLQPNISLKKFAQRNLLNDKDSKLKNFLIAFLKKSDFDISNIEVEKQETELTPQMLKLFESITSDNSKDKIEKMKTFIETDIKFTHATDTGIYELSGEDESLGTNRYLGLAIILYKLLNNAKCILIDEIESSIHYKLMSYFIKSFLELSSNESQLLITTHNINLLDEPFVRRDTIWFTVKNRSVSFTELKRLTLWKLHKNVSIFNAYRQGKFDTVPIVDESLWSDDFRK